MTRTTILALLSCLAWACSQPPAVRAPVASPAAPEHDAFPDLTGLAATSRITIRQSQGGLAGSYMLLLHLFRTSEDWQGVALLTTSSDQAAARRVTVPAAVMDALFTDIATRGEAPPDPPGTTSVAWTDDYPSLELLLHREDRTPVRVFYEDQKRRFRVSDGATAYHLAERPEEASMSLDRGSYRMPQPALHTAYRRIPDAIGLNAWLDELNRAAIPAASDKPGG